LLGIKLDAFQAAALRIGWWVPNVIDESGFGTGKSCGCGRWRSCGAC